MAATLTVRLDVIERNTQAIYSRLSKLGIAVAGVTKATGGDPRVAAAMRAGGAKQIADSRLSNLRRLLPGRRRPRRHPADPELWLLRSPLPDEADLAVALSDVSLVSETATINALAVAAERASVTHQVILMVELGDLREGLVPDQVARVAKKIRAKRHLVLAGVGGSLTCFGAIAPDAKNLAVLAEVAEEVEHAGGHELTWISGGATSSLRAAFAHTLPERINHLRIGEGILLGKDSIDRSDLEGTRQDAFEVTAPVIELASKPSAPWGKVCQDSWGHTPAFKDRGLRARACVAIGRQEFGGGTLEAVDAGVEVLGASADILVCDVEGAHAKLKVGSELRFRLDYGALTALATSPFVQVHHEPAGVEA